MMCKGHAKPGTEWLVCVPNNGLYWNEEHWVVPRCFVWNVSFTSAKGIFENDRNSTAERRSVL